MDYWLYLIDIIPKAGLIYQSKWHVTCHRRRDEYIRKALQHVALMNDSAGQKDRHRAKLTIDNILASIITIATGQDMINQLQDDAHGGNLGLFKFCEDLKARIDWVKNIREPAFCDFIFQLIKARQEWKKSPCYPFELEEHSATARAIDGFLEAAGRRWDSACLDYELFCFFGGLDDSDGCEDDNATMCGTDEDKDEDAGEDDDGDEDEMEEMDIDLRSLQEVLDHEMRTEAMVSKMDKMELD